MSEELMHPKCGGCGHNFFHEPQIPVAQALEEAKTRRCCYCLDDAKEAAKRPPRREFYPEDEREFYPEDER